MITSQQARIATNPIKGVVIEPTHDFYPEQDARSNKHFRPSNYNTTKLRIWIKICMLNS